MHRRSVWAFGLLVCLLTGCALDRPMRSSSWLDRLSPFSGPTGEDVLFMEIVTLTRPAGDAYLDQELWQNLDEVGDLGGKARLEDNGFRIGQVGGIVPPGLQQLLTSERANANPRRRQCRAGNVSELPLSSTLPQCAFTLLNEGQRNEVRLEQAVCALSLVPKLTSDNRILLEFEPQVQHGEKSMWNGSALGGNNWSLQGQRPVEKYPQLGWSATLAPNEYIVVGTRYSAAESLGHRFFIESSEGKPPVQRVLVLRVGRATPSPVNGSNTQTPETTAGKTGAPPLAWQAGFNTARGTAH